MYIFYLVQARCARCSAASQGHPVHGRAEPRSDPGEHRRQELCSDCTGCGSHYAWRLATTVRCNWQCRSAAAVTSLLYILTVWPFLRIQKLKST